MSKYHNFTEAMRDNETKKCSANGCHNYRHRISKYCKRCARQRWYWGHPEATGINRKDYAYEMLLVEEAIRKNTAHCGINDAVNYLDALLKDAHDGFNYFPEAEHAARLYDDAVLGIELLTELSAIYLYSRRFRTKIKSDMHLTYLLGSKFIRCRPYSGRTTGPKHKAVGEFLMNDIGIMLLTVALGAEQVERNKRKEAQNEQHLFETQRMVLG